MKNSKFHVFATVLLVTILVFAGCSKESNNPVVPPVVVAEAKLTLNGAGYTNKAVTLSNGLSAYSLSDTVSIIQFSGKVDNDSLYFAIIFKGNQPGTFNWNDDNGAIIFRTTSTGNFTYIGISQGTTTVSSYGAVNGKVEGTISGKLIEATSQAELNITNGSFSAVRIPDIN
ncbi:MAG: hypothetical protein Q8M94_17405 [Ignavibacteria bacterium]|nr:hypothetical protein [Ignavibacteria bacterium]